VVAGMSISLTLGDELPFSLYLSLKYRFLTGLCAFYHLFPTPSPHLNHYYFIYGISFHLPAKTSSVDSYCA
jgi:hypothetical protein